MRQMPAEPFPGTGPLRPFRPAKPVVIGVLGGVAAGKSAVTAAFAAHGLVAIDADREARTVADEVFREPSARAKLEAITHPRIRARILAAIANAKAAGASVLLDAPLLLEGGLIAYCDHVGFVHASDAARAARAASRGWPAEELARREAAQAPLAAKRAAATFVIDNDGDLATMHAQVARILGELQTRA
jgi:dephospho-CoA kinase